MVAEDIIPSRQTLLKDQGSGQSSEIIVLNEDAGNQSPEQENAVPDTGPEVSPGTADAWTTPACLWPKHRASSTWAPAASSA